MEKLGLGVLAAATCVLVGCGPPALTCQTQTCSTGNGKTYQLCVNVNASETWKFGGMSCSAATSNTTQVMTCTNEVASYCGGGGGGGTGGTGGGGGGGSTPCTYTVSGAQTGSGSCMAEATVDSSSGGIAFTVSDASQQDFNLAATLTGQTALTDGTYTTANAAPGYGAEILFGTTVVYALCSSQCTDSQGNPIPPQGSFTLTITDPGTTQTVGGTTLWSAPQGTLSVVMPFDPSGTATGTVTVAVTL